MLEERQEQSCHSIDLPYQGCLSQSGMMHRRLEEMAEKHVVLVPANLGFSGEIRGRRLIPKYRRTFLGIFEP